MEYKSKLEIDQENINIIKKYGPELYLFINHIKNGYYEIPNKNGEMIESYECSDEEIVNYLNSNKKLYEMLSRKYQIDMLVVPCKLLDNELIKSLKHTENLITLYGVTNSNIDKSLLEDLLSKNNCNYRSDTVIDSSLLYILNKTNNYINFIDNNSYKNIYISDNIMDFDKVIIEVLRFMSKNKTDQIFLYFDITNPKIITDFMPLIERKISDMNITCKIYYRLTREAEMKMSENYTYYLGKHTSNKGVVSSVESVEKMHFDSIDDYIDFCRMMDVIMSRIPTEASDLDKVVYVSQFVINYMDYADHSEIDDVNIILKRGTGVCRDYANITSYLLNNLGVECKTISSFNSDKVNMNDIAQPEGTVGGHEFNVVSIEGIDYFIDNTWENNSNSLWESDYFLVSKDLFKKTHSQYPMIDGYDCPSTYSREKIKDSLNRIISFERNYIIKDEQLSKLLKQERYANIEYALKGNKVNRSM